MGFTGGVRRFAGASLVAALLSGCGSPSRTQQTRSASSDAGTKTIKIGIDLPISGAEASTGIPTRNGAVLAIEDANASSAGGFSFVAYDLDDAPQGVHDPAQGAQNVRQFVADPAVLAMIGPFNSNVGAAEIPITNDAGLVQISPATTSPGLTKGEDAAKLRRSHPDANSFFRVCTTDDRQAAAAADFARSRLHVAKAFVIDDNETYGKGLADMFVTRFTTGGGSIVGHEHLTKGQTDFKALLTKARSLGPDVVFFGGTTSTGGGQLRKQMADAGLGALPFVAGDGIADAEFLHSAGSSADGSYYTVAAPEASKLPSAGRFIAAYRKRWKHDVGAYSANAYAATSVAIAAIRTAIASDGGVAPTRATVLANVRATHAFASPIGPITFDANGDIASGILSVYQVRGGTPRFVEALVEKS